MGRRSWILNRCSRRAANREGPFRIDAQDSIYFFSRKKNNFGALREARDRRCTERADCAASRARADESINRRGARYIVPLHFLTLKYTQDKEPCSRRGERGF